MADTIATAAGLCEITTATPEDVHAVLSMRDEAASLLLNKGITQWLPGELSIEWVRQRVDEHVVSLLQRDRKVIGTVTITWTDELVCGPQQEAAGFIHTLVIQQQFAGLGIGALLLGWAEDHIAASDRPIARLDCVRSNSRLRRYYEASGYHVVGYRDFPDIAWAHEAALYEKQLKWPF